MARKPTATRNPWFRLWTDMVNDPKWRTIARKSGQKIGDVIAVYVHMMTNASNATARGSLENWSDEDIGTALDIDAEQVQAIREAMQARVLDDVRLTGWDKRQPVREDEGAAERKRLQREAEAAAEDAETAPQGKCASSQDVTKCHAVSRQRREEKIREDISTPKPPDGGLVRPARTRAPTIELKTFLDDCKARDERPLRDYAPLWKYTESAGISSDFVALAWAEFRRRFMPGGTSESKKYTDWRKAFRKYVEGNYFRLWAIDANETYFLTTLGKQVQKVHESKEAA